jgi:hypothetical protein
LERWACLIVSLGRWNCRPGLFGGTRRLLENAMHQIIYLVGLIVVIMFILSFLGLR